MNDEELDRTIAERFRAYEAEVHLPGEFRERLVGSVRRRRALRRTWMLGLFLVSAATCVAIAHFGKGDSVRDKAIPSMMAASAPTNETAEASCLMLIGYLRGCFSRSETSRRKEEE